VNKETFKEFLILLMCCDPWPVVDDGANSVTENECIIKEWADRQAQKYGYKNWLEAYQTLS
jgi:hypothetical protein